ncbi:MAG TPA: hypothetical protein VHX37_16040 [Acidobacteriaceae bacterium]|jgi:hypothetical protein|nr:hypothetical protein [Acidobacteriaceae bacterium]
MDSQGSGRFETMGRRVDQHLGGTGDRIEEDVKRVIAYLNDRVVPEVRKNGSLGLHNVADQLRRLADHLDRARGH